MIDGKGLVANSEHIAKDLIESIHRRTLRTLIGNAPDRLREVVSQLKNKGFFVIKDFWSSERCLAAIRQIELGIDSSTDNCHHWVDPEGSDYRLWYAENLGGEMVSFFDDPLIEMVRKYYSGIEIAESLVLAARLSYIADNKGSGGGWHRDSPHTLQFKAILYLSDVSEENGPFQYLEETHHSSSAIRLLRQKLCSPNQYRFTEDEIAQIMAESVPFHTFTATAGTLILVDTKGIHRGKPIEVGNRYALTKYCFNGKKPENFMN
jgi:Phytanoyl-CoA dioxygenase (PhyH)